MNAPFSAQRRYTRSAGIKDTFGDFTCLNCGNLVPANSLLSGVRNRNHCPYCLSSRHLDLYEPGDRLSACKERMAPLGLALKHSSSRYAGHTAGIPAATGQGELMLVHVCQGCGKLSANRIAADDDSSRLWAVFEGQARLDLARLGALNASGITLLGAPQTALVQVRLFGRN